MMCRMAVSPADAARRPSSYLVGPDGVVLSTSSVAPMVALPKGASAHARAVQGLLDSYRAIPLGSTVRLAKRTSNLFRPRTAVKTPGLDVTGLDGVISIDVAGRTADVQGMCTYERLVAVTLAEGLMPLVVPQLRTITLGGAVTGLGIESTSFRNGLPHESVLELDVLTGAGEIVTATPTNEHADLFRAFPNSYGSLGYSVRLKIELERVHPYVALRNVRCGSLTAVADAIARIVADRSWDGEPVDFLDGVVFGADESYLVLGRWADSAPAPSDYTGQQIYYRSLQQRSQDALTVHDYLWRWDTDWFWCSRAFGAQNPRLRRIWPASKRRSDVYHRMVGLENRYGIVAAIDKRRGLPARERVIQDVEIPIERTAEFVAWFLEHVPMTPIWLCPLQLRAPGSASAAAGSSAAGSSAAGSGAAGSGAAGSGVTGSASSGSGAESGLASESGQPWPLYPLQRDELYVNVGFWGAIPIQSGHVDGDMNRLIEAAVADHGGHKSLYSDAYYPEAEFWARYGGDAYRPVKQRYDPDHRLLDLYAKAVRRA